VLDLQAQSVDADYFNRIERGVGAHQHAIYSPCVNDRNNFGRPLFFFSGTGQGANATAVDFTRETKCLPRLIRPSAILPLA